MVGSGGLCVSWPMCSQHCLSVDRSCHQSHPKLTQLLLPASLWWVGKVWGWAGSRVCSSVISNGFSYSEYRPLRLKRVFWPFSLSSQWGFYCHRGLAGFGTLPPIALLLYSLLWSQPHCVPAKQAVCVLPFTLWNSIAITSVGTMGWIPAPGSVPPVLSPLFTGIC